MDYTQFVKGELLALIPALYALGAVIKKTEKVKDNYIPSILTAVSVALCCLYVFGSCGITAECVFTAIVQGVLCAACAVYGNQLVKQASK